MRRIEIRDQHIVDHVGVGRRLRRIRHFHKVLEFLAGRIRDDALGDRQAGRWNEPVAARVDQHFQNLVAHGERPGATKLHEGVRLVVLGQMQAERTALANIINDKDRPDAGLDRLRVGQRRDRRADVPDRLEIALDLKIDRCGNSGQIGQRDEARARGKSDTLWDHRFPLLSMSRRASNALPCPRLDPQGQ